MVYIVINVVSMYGLWILLRLPTLLLQVQCWLQIITV